MTPAIASSMSCWVQPSTRLAYSRNDRTAERRAYRQVLDLLNSEDKNRLLGLTGSPEKDERLRELIAILLSTEG